MTYFQDKISFTLAVTSEDIVAPEDEVPSLEQHAKDSVFAGGMTF